MILVRPKSRLIGDFFNKKATNKPTKFRQKHTIFTIPTHLSLFHTKNAFHTFH